MPIAVTCPTNIGILQAYHHRDNNDMLLCNDNRFAVVVVEGVFPRVLLMNVANTHIERKSADESSQRK